MLILLIPVARELFTGWKKIVSAFIGYWI